MADLATNVGGAGQEARCHCGPRTGCAVLFGPRFSVRAKRHTDCLLSLCPRSLRGALVARTGFEPVLLA